MPRWMQSLVLAAAAAGIGPQAPRLTYRPAHAPWDWEAAGAEIAATCGLDVTVRCGAPGCAASAVLPDLDRFDTWVELAFTSTPFVIDVVAHDLGAEAPLTLCGQAIEALAPHDLKEMDPLQGRSRLCLTQGAFSRSRSLCFPGPRSDAASWRVRTLSWYGRR